MTETRPPYTYGTASAPPAPQVCPRCHSVIDAALPHDCHPVVSSSAVVQAQVTGYDVAAEFYARLRTNGLLEIVTAQAYHQALQLAEALALEIEAWEVGMAGR